MTTAAQMRKLALSMPEAEEKSHFEQPDFRVRGKIFAGLSRDEKIGTLKLTPELQSMMGAHRDGAGPFRPATGAWGQKGWTQVDLAAVEVGVLEDLVAEAWRLVAPKALLAAGTESSRPKPAAKAPRSAKPKKTTKPKRPRSSSR